ncbi:NAD(P)-binding protein [Calocera cornea HHB12733]|uniref:NAD(P)-binding protein n=1 Tax=Calocera cornea HHB12733 TaxID=1353952 RepID=A0A165FLT2_9BASI|nr:NAD(P)-binding protein [Calocera cornea HHB12733]
MTRNPSSDKSQALKAKGIEVVQGDMSDGQSIRTALTGCERAFLVTDYQAKGVEGETESGNLFVDQAAAVGVKHLVFSSVGNADTHTGVPHFESKFLIEQHLRTSTIPSWTILRPAAFMENFPPAGGMQRMMTLGLFDAALQGKSLKLCSVIDIGWFAAQALEKPGEWNGRIMELAGDDITVAGMKAAYEKVEGGKPWEVPIPQLALGAMLPKEMYLMFTWFREGGYVADIGACRSIHPGMLTFEEWVRVKHHDD